LKHQIDIAVDFLQIQQGGHHNYKQSAITLNLNSLPKCFAPSLDSKQPFSGLVVLAWFREIKNIHSLKF